MSWNFRSRKMSAPQLRHLANRFGPCGCEQLAANLEHADKIRHLLGEVQRCGIRESKSRATSDCCWMGVKGQGSGRARNSYFWLSSARSRLAAFRISSSRTCLLPSGSGQSFGPTDRIHQFRGLLGRDPIINTYHFKLTVTRVDDAHPGVEGVRFGCAAVRASQLKGLPFGGPLAIEVRTIPTGGCRSRPLWV